MAIIKDYNIKKTDIISRENETKTKATILIGNKNKLIKIQTYGSKDRKYKDKVSQQITFTKKQLKEFLNNFS